MSDMKLLSIIVIVTNGEPDSITDDLALQLRQSLRLPTNFSLPLFSLTRWIAFWDSVALLSMKPLRT